MSQEFSLFDNEEKVIKQAEELACSFQEHSQLVLQSLKGLTADYRKSLREQQRLVRVSDRQQTQMRQLTIELQEAKEGLKQFNEKLSVRVQEELAKRKELEKEAEMQQAILIQQTKLAELGNMIGAISHQWQQPLNAISLSEQLLMMDFEDGLLNKEVLAKHKDLVLNQIQFMVQTMNDFRNFYKPSVEKECFSVLYEVRSMLSLLDGMIKENSIDVQIHGSDNVFSVGYPGEFKQVVLNIINNTRDAFIEREVENRRIIIEVKDEESMATLTITDNAGGIPLELLPKIFEPFVSTKGAKGTGIGLSMGKMIIEEKMGGKLWVQNTDNGAKFVMQMPTK